MLALDQRGPHAELRRPDRGDVAAGPTADHHQIELVLRHQAFLFRRRFFGVFASGKAEAAPRP